MKMLLPIVFVFFLAFSAYSQEAAVISEKANLRSSPAAKGRIMKVLTKNTIVKVIRKKGTWSLIQWNGAQGWLHTSTISPVVRAMRVDRMTKLGSVDSDTGARVVSSGESSGGFVPSPKGARPKTISGGVLNGKATNLPKPSYPAAAKAVRASGSVSVQVLIDESGRVISASAVSGHPLLRAAAVSAAQDSTFSPTLLDGQPVKVSGVITYNFIPGP